MITSISFYLWPSFSVIHFVLDLMQEPDSTLKLSRNYLTCIIVRDKSNVIITSAIVTVCANMEALSRFSPLLVSNQNVSSITATAATSNFSLFATAAGFAVVSFSFRG